MTGLLRKIKNKMSKKDEPTEIPKIHGAKKSLNNTELSRIGALFRDKGKAFDFCEIEEAGEKELRFQETIKFFIILAIFSASFGTFVYVFYSF